MSRSLFLSLGMLSVFCTTSVAQPPGIDGIRWDSTGGIALTQAQGFAQGDPLRLTWGFAKELDGTTSIPGLGHGVTGDSNLIARLDLLFGSGPGGTDLTMRPWFGHFQGVFDRWSSISGLSYQYEANDDGATFSDTNSASTRGLLGTRADIRIGGRNIDGNNGILAFNIFPNGGDMVIDTNDSFFSAGNLIGLRNVVAHEHGHGMGQSHVVADNSFQLMEPLVNTTFDGPQHHDILVAQRAYGDFHEKSFGGLGNDVVARATALGNIAMGAALSVGNAAKTFAVPASATDFVSIDDNTDTDIWSFVVLQAGPVDILLESLGFTYNTKPQNTGSTIAFDSEERSDLTLELLDTDGSTVLATSNTTGLGGDESINGYFLTLSPAGLGLYYIRVTGADNPDSISLDTQFYSLSVGYSVVPEPATVSLWVAGGLAFGFARRRRHRPGIA